jgi:two-component system sensor kinase FixL
MIGNLTYRYLIALALVTALVLGNQALVQPYLIRLTSDAPLINLAGRQRMLSQRLAKASLAAVASGGGDGAGAALQEMEQVLELWSVSHEQLHDAEVAKGRTSRNSKAVRDGLQALEPHFFAMRDAARRVIEASEGDRPDAAEAKERVNVILDHEAEYLRQMDRVVGLHELEARGRIKLLSWIGWALASLTVAALIAIGLFILRPAARLIGRQFDELGRAYEELEARVRERTRELEEATERHQALLEQFSHAGRTSAVGEMASGLAHELKQPLGAIAYYAEGCLITLEAPEPELGAVRSALLQVRETTMRAGRIIDQVRRFVTRQVPSPERFAVSAVVQDAVELLRAESGRGGLLPQIELAPDLPSLWGEPIQIEQVLVNLLRNAQESLAQSQTPSPTLVIWARPTDTDGVEFGVRDNGEGIPADRLDRIFDAYFSTRADGMGMGLAISRTIVEAHQGQFFVESEPGVQTTFRFRLPAARPDHERADRLHRG